MLIENNQIVHIFCPILIDNKVYFFLSNRIAGTYLYYKENYMVKKMLFQTPTITQVPLEYLPFITDFIAKILKLQAFLWLPIATSVIIPSS